jgi:hypothetical protein
VDFNCLLIKEDWLDACIALRVVGAVLVVFLQRWRKFFLQSSTNGKQRLIPEEMSQTLLTNKKQGTPD